MQEHTKRVLDAIHDLKQGKMIVLTDHPERENEGDLVMLAEKITPDDMNFMIRNGSGIVCIAAADEILQKFNLPLMVAVTENTSNVGTPFTISVDAREGGTSGVSALDRTKTVAVLMDDQAVAEDLVRPGHMFPLRAQKNGVFARQGHTEGSVDLAIIAGFKPAAVICEIMSPDGTMMRGKDLQAFSEQHGLTSVSIDDIIDYRLQHEILIAEEASASLPLANYGTFTITIVREKNNNLEHLVLHKESKNPQLPPLVRIHSSCMTGDLFASERCDCNKQLHHSLERISKEGGFLIYLHQEGRGIGLFNKIKAYALQECGHDTVEANEILGLPVDSRTYHIAAHILRRYHVHQIRLLTGNPEKVNDLKKYGITHIDIESMPSFMHEHNLVYLKTKIEKLNHIINLEQTNDFQGTVNHE